MSEPTADEVVQQFTYKLNAMQAAADNENPYTAGYPAARQAVFAFVRALASRPAGAAAGPSERDVYDVVRQAIEDAHEAATDDGKTSFDEWAGFAAELASSRLAAAVPPAAAQPPADEPYLTLHFTFPGVHPPTNDECKAALGAARRTLGYTLGAWWEASAGPAAAAAQPGERERAVLEKLRPFAEQWAGLSDMRGMASGIILRALAGATHE